MFEPVPKHFDVPELERGIIRFWEQNEVERLYLERNRDSDELFRFLDGPITANGPMGVHHAWGRTYKDLWQCYNTMQGKRQRYQNGFDGQGLWVEVTVERELGFNSKRDIEAYGIAEFVRKCKQSVLNFADMQTRQSRRLGYFMDWDNSYYTLSDENNYTIWHFLKVCHQRGLLYQGTDVMPWCTRCGIGISEQETAEGYEELTHCSVYVRFPLVGCPSESLLVWTTTPWTLSANVAVAANPALTYVKVRQNGEILYLAKGALASLQGGYEVLEELPGSALLGLTYRGPFHELPALQGIECAVIPWDEVSEAEGTGLVHIAPGCGREDFALAKELGLRVVPPIDQAGVYGEGFGWLSGRNVQQVADDIVEDLDRKGLLYGVHGYTHRYPTCWRCHTELVFRLVDEWFIAMDPLREPMMRIAREVRWIPAYGLDRELDWLRNMDDWMISKQRYWGLALMMRWLFCRHNPETNLDFGWRPLEDTKRRLLVLWNTYSFFVTYANLDGWKPGGAAVHPADRPLLDRWARALLNRLVAEVRSALDGYDAMAASSAIEAFVEELSTWYVRRSRRRFWKAENDPDKRAAYETLYECLTILTRLLAPFMPFVSEALYQNLVRRASADQPISVHLTSYPEPNDTAIDAALLDAMEAAQRVVALGRAARDRARINVRQPLRTMYVRVSRQETREDIQQLQDIILGELNVKHLQFAQTEDEFVAYDVRPNLPVLGPRYGKRVPQIRQALSTLDPAWVARSVERGQTVRLSLTGDTIELLPHEVLAEAREREGYAAMADGGYLVVLDTRLDRELLHEGLAREVVRRINNWRKAAGFKIENRIAVWYEAGPGLAAAIEEHREYICRETLATSLVKGLPLDGEFQAEALIEKETLTGSF